MEMNFPNEGYAHNSFHIEDFIQISIKDRKMSATLRFTPQSKEFQITEEELLNFISSCGVKHGLLMDQIHSFLQNPTAFRGQEIEIARGKDAIHGQDSYLEMIYEQKGDKKPKLKEDGSVDFYSIIEISNVDKGELLAKKIPATHGVEGITVTGEIIEAKDGRDIPIKKGKNVVVDEESQAIYAVVAGQVSMLNDRINVFPVFEVNGDLDFSVGNIDFIGNVVIRGNIPTGFSVKSKGDIRVTGGVEGAILEAEGSIDIGSGITAQHKGHIKAGKDIKTSFIVNGKVHAEGNVIVSQSIMHSEISAGDSIICNGPKGIIVGGTLQAGKSVICRVIGNSLNTPTTIEIGMNPQLLNRMKEIEQELAENKATLTKNNQALNILNDMLRQHGKLPESRQELYVTLTQNKKATEQKIKQMTEEYEQLKLGQKEEWQASVEVYSIIYPGTKLTFNKYTRYFKERQERVKFRLEQGEIISVPIV